LEGCKPSKNNAFLVVIAAKPAITTRNMEISGRLRLPEPLHRVDPDIIREE
jgi:hypothetical protein